VRAQLRLVTRRRAVCPEGSCAAAVGRGRSV
jgi:hypothetical protein